MKPYLSLIIPYHNSHNSVGYLLSSIYASKHAPSFEVIIVDDGSREKFMVNSSWFMDRKNQKTINHPLRTIYLNSNKGPAVARNKGAKLARGKFLVFLDSDVELFPDTLHNLTRIYQEDSDIVALTGVWVKEQKTTAFFPNFKALRDWSYWINERDKSGYYFLFSTRIASIKKAVFRRLGGFDEQYPGALVEDIELTYRIARRYAIIFAPNVRVMHQFEDFWPIAKKYFLRAYYWTKLYASRKKFDPVATTLQEAMTAVSGVGVIGLMGVAIILGATGYWVTIGIDPNMSFKLLRILKLLNLSILVLWIGVLLFHLILVRKFLVFMYQEKGLLFAIKGFFTGLVLYCFITAGAFWGRLK